MTQTFFRDLRIGFRVLAKERSFCALAVTVLSLGICGVTTMFSVVNAVMIRGFSFPNADRLVSLNFVDPTTATANGVNGQTSAMDYKELVPIQRSFAMISAYLNGSTVNVTVNDHPQRYTGAYVTEDFLRILGAAPMMGRDFRAEDNQPGAEKVALIGYGVWQRDFGGVADVVGRAVRINGKPATIVGVMPKGFAFPTNEELWIPLFSEFPPLPRNDPNAVNPALLGLLKPGVSFDTATAELTTIAARFAKAYPENKRFTAGQVDPLLKTFTGPQLRGTLLTMLGFCVGVLLIACANVMNMQFARATLRAKELAVRSSLGATRGRLVRQMLTESLLLATIGAVVGIALAYGAIDWLAATLHGMDNPPPAWIVFDVDRTVLVGTVAATMAAAIVSGLLPALSSSRTRAVEVLRDTGRGNTSRRMNLVSRGLVVFQLVVTCVLLIGSLLQLQSILQQQRIDYGYDTNGIMSARMGLMEGAYPTADARKTFFDRLLRALQDDQAFGAVGLTNRFRMVFAGNGPIEIEGKVYPRDRDRPTTNFEQVTGSYFAVTHQQVVEGRVFRDNDADSGEAIAVVNTAFAHKHFGTQSALGRRFRTVDGAGQPAPWRTIVGVVSTVRMLGPFNNPGVDDSGFYVPFYGQVFGPSTAPLATQFATVAVRPRAGSPEAVTTALRRDIQRIDPDLPLYFVGTPQSQIDGFVAQNRVVAVMFAIFGVVAMVLAAVGIYGVMSFSVNQRTQEFGVRMALGANRGRILALVLRQGSLQLGIGLVVGLGLSLAIATAGAAGIQGTLFNVNPTDPRVYGGVALLIMIVAAVATLVPARRATDVDPMTALRAE